MAKNNETILENIRDATMEEVMHNSMMPYSEHVILERALPRAEDGLKPVQRRVLYAMHGMNLFPDRPYRKCATIVGEVMGKYHPHGDSSIYDTLVRLAQDFNMRAPLVDGHGNFGTVDGDGAAAQRYTEARLHSLATEMLRDIEKDTVPWSLNFDDSLQEPDLLPSRFPNLLVNGSSGIAVGFATNIPPHNLAEVIDGAVALLDSPRLPLSELLKLIKGPDFPTGGIIMNPEELEAAYTTGRGKLLVRARVEVENGQNGKKLLVITEIPYALNKTALLQKIQALREERKGILTAISDIRDESDRQGMRAVIELRKDSDPQKVLQYLYKYSDLQTTFGVNMIAIAGGKPQQLGLLELLRCYLEHQKEVERRRVKYDLDWARSREEIVRGLVIAVQNIDRVIKIIRSSATVPKARDNLREAFALSERQATAILELRLQRLTALEIEKLEAELAELRALIAELEGILASKQKLNEVIRKSLQDIRRRYKDARRTVILSAREQKHEAETALKPEDFKVVTEAVVAVDQEGYIKRVPQKNFARSATKEAGAPAETPLDVIFTLTDRTLYVFTDRGNCCVVTVEDIPEGKWRDRGAPPARLFPGWEAGEKPVYIAQFDAPPPLLCLVTRAGMVKLTPFSEFAIKKARFKAIGLKEGDALLSVEPHREGATLLMISEQGQSLNAEINWEPTGRTAAGVKGMALENDRLVFAAEISAEGEVVVWTDKGYAKRSLAADYEPGVRGRKGQRTIEWKKNGANGNRLIAALYVKEPFTQLCVHKNNTTDTVDTEMLAIEPRGGPGKPYCLAVLGDELTGVLKLV